MIRVPMVDGAPDLPDGFVGTATLTEDGEYELRLSGTIEDVNAASDDAYYKFDIILIKALEATDG